MVLLNKGSNEKISNHPPPHRDRSLNRIRSIHAAAERMGAPHATTTKLDPAKLKEAVDFAIVSESRAPRDLQLAHFQTFGREPYGEPIGQFKIAETPPDSSSATDTSSPNGVTPTAST